jgi:TetR/AcrR family transcriptional repressor of nem operon
MNKVSTTNDAILACARNLIIQGGYNGFSYADIAEAVGIRKASIHHHFPSKADLVRALIVRHREDTEAGFVALEAQLSDPVEQLKAYTDYWNGCIQDATASFCVCALLASELPVLPRNLVPEIRAYFQSLSGWLSTVLARGVQEGRIVLGQSVHVEAEGFMATVHGAMLSARAYGDPTMFSLVVDPLLLRLKA